MTEKKHINWVKRAWGAGDAVQDELTLVLEYIEKLAKEDPRDFQDLVDLVDSLPEDNEIHLAGKLFLAEILVDLKYEPIKELLVRIISLPIEDPIAREGYGRVTIRSNQINAASMLVALEDARGKKFLEKFMHIAVAEEKKLIVMELKEILNIMAFRLLLQFADEDESIPSQINREQIEYNLRLLSEPVDE